MLQVIGNNDYTDQKEYDLVLKCVNNELIWGYYRSSSTKIRISDSQFDVCSIEQTQDWVEVAEEKLRGTYKCYSVVLENV